MNSGLSEKALWMRNLLQLERVAVPSNIPSKFVTRGTDQRSGWLNLSALVNVHPMSLTCETSQESTA